jgi:cytochrome c5
MSEENEMSDAQFGKIFATMIGGLVALTIVLIILAYIMGGAVSSAQSEEQVQQRAAEVAARTAPIGKITVGQAAEVYTSTCAGCHAAGVAGAPKTGDAAVWQERLAQGKDALYEHAIKGFQGKAGFMPAKGGNASLSDEAVKAAVDHMLQNSQ